MRTSKSESLFYQAQALFPGGVNSPVRAFRAVGGQPLFIERGEGPYLFDADGNRFVDYVLSWGPLILGHAPAQVVTAIANAAARGTSYGAPNPHEVELATLVQSLVPSLEMMRFVNSGTEATMSALRLARAFTGRNKIIKFEGCYHGHADFLLVKAGSGVATLGLPDSPGVPPATVADTLVAPFNDSNYVEMLFEQNRDQIAAIIVEPVVGNMGVVPPAFGFLERLRELATAYNTLLIFDEVMTGFRVHPGGAQQLYGIKPDLTTLGKVIGGGLPVGAYGGRRDIMELIAPSGPVYQAGTLSGNPLAMVAGIETLRALQQTGTWDLADEATAHLAAGLHEIVKSLRLTATVQRIGTMFTLFFAQGPITNWSQARTADTAKFASFFRAMLENGVYWPPSQFEAAFSSTAHTPEIVASTLAAAERALAR